MILERQICGRIDGLRETTRWKVEGIFPDGTKLITIDDAIASEYGNLAPVLHGSFLPVPPLDKFPWAEDNINTGDMIYGRKDSIAINSKRKAIILRVINTGDRPIQLGSYYHFMDVNHFLVFDRWKACGMRLNIAAGTAIRFEPGDCKKSHTFKDWR
nr:urease-like [Ziziphus jujuba var. spinosa]